MQEPQYVSVASAKLFDFKIAKSARLTNSESYSTIKFRFY